jgi:hypothetical protein
MRDNPDRLAWTVLLLAFGVFCITVVSIPLGGRWYLLNSMKVEVTAVTSIHGTVLAETRTASLPIPITDGNTSEVEEATRITTDDTSQAILTFFDDSTLTLYGQTRLRIQTTRSPRFGTSQQPNTIIVELERGRVRAVPSERANPQASTGLRFEVVSPQALVRLSQGSFSVEATATDTQVSARTGQAYIEAGGQQVLVNTGERSLASAGNTPSPPLPAEQNLLVSGNFAAPLEGTWVVYRIEPPGGVVTTSVRLVTAGAEAGIQLLSSGKDNLHSEIGMTQQINKSVQDFNSLRIQLDVRLNRQSLPGGGTLGSEFPLMVHLAYKDADGNDRDWYHGFYVTSPSQDWLLPGTPDNSSEHVVPFLWYPYESPNLFDTLGPAKPEYLKYIRVYASGWLYDADVANITLLAQD